MVLFFWQERRMMFSFSSYKKKDLYFHFLECLLLLEASIIHTVEQHDHMVLIRRSRRSVCRRSRLVLLTCLISYCSCLHFRCSVYQRIIVNKQSINGAPGDDVGHQVASRVSSFVVDYKTKREEIKRSSGIVEQPNSTYILVDFFVYI